MTIGWAMVLGAALVLVLQMVWKDLARAERNSKVGR